MPRFFLALLACLPPLQGAPFLVAHRGASEANPENTLPAFELAWKQGANAIEGDFRLTRDGHIICLHDATTKRTSSRNLTVDRSTLEELRLLDVGTWKGPEWKGTRIPTLAEVLATVPKHGTLFLEVKCGPEIIPPLLAELDQCPLRIDQITLISFNTEVIRAYKIAAPKRPASWLCSFKKKLGRTKPTRAMVLDTLTTIKADGLSSNPWKAIDSTFLDQLRKLGCQHHVWTVNDAPTARHFLELGTTSITTDRPGLLRQELAR